MTAPRAVRVLIVDDEPLARRRVAELLGEESGVEIVGTATSGAEAVAAIRAHAPDVVFLDVQMPDGTGLDVVREIGPDAMPVTVFVTAYDQYALKAFDAAAVDYLVKPYDDERFVQAFQRARESVESKRLRRLSGELLAALQAVQGGGATPVPAAPLREEADVATPAPAAAPAATPARPDYLERIAVEIRGQVRVVPVAKVQYVTASGPYVEIHTPERTYLIREQMQVLEDRLDPERFFRVHRSAIVRLDLIEGLTRNASGDYTVQLRGGLQLKVSRSRSEELERRMGLAK
ncbi:response regulator receiver (plasmid) [Gemmatirosa kalamazoonensis]|uniref:Response regulator receiver n=1 Tax=Gemmatirosa kalamazoonensis TaxID=861299 RepID=W0RNS7_9BACT|nr:LytTR family DNA-binding domain-containing protein [Gemmatirosa kalamazoonensis]AHG92654.1 response regulator receiver [Gemmatirosa kalamazoonensis]